MHRGFLIPFAGFLYLLPAQGSLPGLPDSEQHRQPRDFTRGWFFYL